MTTNVRRILFTATTTLLISAGGAVASAPASAGTFVGPVKMQRACNDQYPGQGLKAVLLDKRDAYTWKCASPEGFLGDIDVNRYCATRYGDGAYAGLRDRTKPRSWYCQR
jgi:hypothetical protein